MEFLCDSGTTINYTYVDYNRLLRNIYSNYFSHHSNNTNEILSKNKGHNYATFEKNKDNRNSMD